MYSKINKSGKIYVLFFLNQQNILTLFIRKTKKRQKCFRFPLLNFAFFGISGLFKETTKILQNKNVECFYVKKILYRNPLHLDNKSKYLCLVNMYRNSLFNFTFYLIHQTTQTTHKIGSLARNIAEHFHINYCEIFHLEILSNRVLSFFFFVEIFVKQKLYRRIWENFLLPGKSQVSSLSSVKYQTGVSLDGK